MTYVAGEWSIIPKHQVIRMIRDAATAEGGVTKLSHKLGVTDEYIYAMINERRPIRGAILEHIGVERVSFFQRVQPPKAHLSRKHLAEIARDLQDRVKAGQLDLRDVGRALTGRWDQDIIAAMLAALAEGGDEAEEEPHDP